MKKIILFFVLLLMSDHVYATLQDKKIEKKHFKKEFEKAQTAYNQAFKSAKKVLPFLEEGRYLFDVNFGANTLKMDAAVAHNKALERFELAHAIYKQARGIKAPYQGKDMTQYADEIAEHALHVMEKPELDKNSLIPRKPMPRGSLSLKERWRLFKLNRRNKNDTLSYYDLGEYVNLRARSKSLSIPERISYHFLSRKVKKEGLGSLTFKEKMKYDMLCAKKENYKEVS